MGIELGLEEEYAHHYKFEKVLIVKLKDKVECHQDLFQDLNLLDQAYLHLKVRRMYLVKKITSIKEIFWKQLEKVLEVWQFMNQQLKVQLFLLSSKSQKQALNTFLCQEMKRNSWTKD